MFIYLSIDAFAKYRDQYEVLNVRKLREEDLQLYQQFGGPEKLFLIGGEMPWTQPWKSKVDDPATLEHFAAEEPRSGFETKAIRIQPQSGFESRLQLTDREIRGTVARGTRYAMAIPGTFSVIVTGHTQEE